MATPKSKWFKPNFLIFSACSHSGGQPERMELWDSMDGYPDPKKPAFRSKPGPECENPMATPNEIVIH